MNPSRATLELTWLHRAELARWARRSYPREACGLMLGRREGARTAVVRVCEARNLAPHGGHERFELDPADHFAAEARARELGLEVVGAWHSHPDQPARPSEHDRSGGVPGWCCVIVSVSAEGPSELRAWRLAPGRAVELGLEEAP